jgi:hypothetical protein
MDNGAHPTLADARDILPPGVVVLSVNPKTKAPFRDSWQLITYADTQAADYQSELGRAETASGGWAGFTCHRRRCMYATSRASAVRWSGCMAAPAPLGLRLV